MSKPAESKNFSQQMSLEKILSLDGVKEYVRKLEKEINERILRVETLTDSLTTGQSIISAALTNAGLLTPDGEPVPPRKQEKWDPDKIKWVDAEGARGPYQRYPAAGQKAESTDNYRNMLADLKQHGGKMMRDGWFYWVFTDSATIGRKKRLK